MKSFAAPLSGVTPATLDYGWLAAGLAAVQAATVTARSHAAAVRGAARQEQPCTALIGCFADDGATGGSFNTRVARRLADR